MSEKRREGRALFGGAGIPVGKFKPPECRLCGLPGTSFMLLDCKTCDPVTGKFRGCRRCIDAFTLTMGYTKVMSEVVEYAHAQACSGRPSILLVKP